MNTHPETLDRMLAVWNNRDMSSLKLSLEAILAPEVVFIDPTIVTAGINEFAENVRAFRAKYPDADLRRTSGIDSHHNLHRYSWDIVLGQRTLVVGFDVTETDSKGRILRVLGFFGPLPQLPG